MIKQVLYFVCFSLVLYMLHQFVLISQFNNLEKIPVAYQHILLGGFSLGIYLVTVFMAEHYFDKAGFAVLGFLLLKMIFIFIFINNYSIEIKEFPLLKYVFIGFYFAYLMFLLLKIVPIINIDLTKKIDKKQ